MRIAIISDIHGNLEALKTTLEDIKKRNIDKIFCLGDTVQKGHHSEECVKLVRENCEVSLQGNCDINMDDKPTESVHSIPLDLLKKRVEWINELLSEESKEYLRNLPFSYEFYMSGSLIRLFHAHPEKLDGVIAEDNSYETKYKMFEPSEKTIMVIYMHLL